MFLLGYKGTSTTVDEEGTSDLLFFETLDFFL